LHGFPTINAPFDRAPAGRSDSLLQLSETGYPDQSDPPSDLLGFVSNQLPSDRNNRGPSHRNNSA
jgi:hypothetical protein